MGKGFERKFPNILIGKGEKPHRQLGEKTFHYSIDGEVLKGSEKNWGLLIQVIEIHLLAS